jgi:CheY-like chemotaxis protein
MNAINGLSRLLLDKPHDIQTREYLEAISHSGENMQVILNDILDLAKLEAGQFLIHPIAFDLQKEAEQVIRIFNAKALDKGLYLKLEIDEKVPRFIVADAARLSQIWSNLISNALKFTQTGGVKLKISVTETPNSLKMEVSDTGVGIAANELAHVFESFVQLNPNMTSLPQGTGLGLTIAKNLAERMGGQLQVESKFGSGTSLSFLLKYELANEQDVSKRVFSPVKLSETKHIVIAEDNDYNFLVTKDVLLKYYPGIQLYRAHDGLEAIALLEEDEYDLILMDLKMPKMSGNEAAMEIRNKGCKTPIIALSASVTNQEMELCLNSGMNDFIMKPFNDEDLIQVLNRYFETDALVENSNNESNIDKTHLIQFGPQLITELSEALSDLNFDTIRMTAHKARPLLIRSGCNELALLCEELEHQNVNDEIFINKSKLLLKEFNTEISKYL